MRFHPDFMQDEKWVITTLPALTYCVYLFSRCRQLSDSGLARKATLPMQARREQQIIVVRQAVLRKPAKASRNLHRKRTPFTLKREGSLVVGGSKMAIYKGASDVVRKKPASDIVRKKPSVKKKPARRA